MLKIAVIAFDRISPFHLSAPCVVFAERHPGLPAIDLRVCSAEGRELQTTAGFTIRPAYDLSAVSTADIVIVPSWRDPAEPPPPALIAALQERAAAGALLVGLCLGAYVLAAAGLLDDYAATTHWAYAKDFVKRFPGVRLNPEVLYVEDRERLTSAGTVAAIDCCLHLLRRQLGAQVANSVARRLVAAPHRQGGQAQFIEQPLPAAAQDARLSQLLDWLRQNLSTEHSLDSLAERALMSRRSLTRHFRSLTGESPLGWLKRERLAYAQRLLAETRQDIESIASQCGFGTPLSLRLHFRAAFGLSPGTWRRNFNESMMSMPRQQAAETKSASQSGV